MAGRKILDITASDLVRTSMEAYAKEVIEDRSLPDYRDGLKLSQRRILYYMSSEGLSSEGNYKASANVVGGVLGRLHPHSDVGIFDTLVRLNSNTVSPVDGDGSWGDLHSEAAAMRYTKVKLSPFGDRFCRDMATADWIPTYSGEWTEPVVLPSPIPFSLLAGTNGIAVAVSTAIPSHNLSELVTTFLKVLHGEQDIDRIVGTTLLGPESKTGGVVISSLDEIRDMYRLGRGKIRWRCDYTMTFDKKADEWSLIITGIPEGFALSSWLVKMKSHAERNMLRIENESCADDPIRFVVTFNNVAYFYDVIEPSLYCIESYNFNLIAKAGERAVDISLQHHSLLSWIDSWLVWRESIEIKILTSRIEKLERDLYREQAKHFASENIDAIIACIKNSQNPSKDLKSKFKLEDQQVKIISEMQLQAISRLSKDRQEKTIKSLNLEIASETKKLSKPKLLVEQTLKSLLQFDTIGRCAKIDHGDSEIQKHQKLLKKSDGKPNYWTIETSKPRTLCQLGSELPLKKKSRNPYLGIVNAQESVITVTEKGEIRRWSISELCERDIGYSYVAILSPNHQQIVLSCNNGVWANFLMEQKASDWTTKLLQSGEDKILSASGISKGDILWIYSDSHLESLVCDWQPFKRSSKTGWKSSWLGKDIRLLVIPKHSSLVIDSHRYSFTDLIRPKKDLISKFLHATAFDYETKNYYLFNPNNDTNRLLCITMDGVRLALTGKEIANNQIDLLQTYLIV